MHFFTPSIIDRGSDTLLLFVHGYTGGPGAFIPFLSMVDMDFRSIVLPGHGEDYGNFLTIKAEDWILSVRETIQEMRNRYKRVYLAGYSLGGIVSLLSSSLVDALFLFAPAVIKTDNTKIDTKNRLALKDVNPALLALCDDEDKQILQYFLNIDTSVVDKELERCRSMLYEKRQNLSIPSFAYVGQKDSVVPYVEAIDYLESINISVREFENSTHAILYGDGYEDVRTSFKHDLDLVDNGYDLA